MNRRVMSVLLLASVLSATGCSTSPVVQVETVTLKPDRAMLTRIPVPVMPAVPDDEAAALSILLEHDLRATGGLLICNDRLTTMDRLYWGDTGEPR